MQKFEARQLEKAQSEKQVPKFSSGDTIKVNVRVKEGTRERIQAFEGVCISRKGSGINETFTVRKISYGEGVERVFPLWSSRIDGIELVRRGSVRRSKLYYLRNRRGKSARISERISGHGIEIATDATVEGMTKTKKRAQKKEAKQAARAKARKIHEDAASAKAKAKADEAAAKLDEAKTEDAQASSKNEE
ncbi:MAG: 50S ribosomal protein L19 [Alphaproteobacteria bacterium]|nr:50S ribosomal protein L19 [Alphaproteobacteria bacterium]